MAFTFLIWLLATVVPLTLTYFAAGYESLRVFTPLVAGTVAFTMMAFNLVLATRPPMIEGLLGGLDRVYALHKQFGIAILVLVLIHTQFPFPQLEGLVPPGSLAEFGKEIAEPAFYVLAVLAVLSIIKRIPKLPFEIPWDLWRWTHRLMGPVFVVLAVHQLLVKAPFASTDGIKLWTSAMTIAGVAAWLWTLVTPLLRRRAYVVDSVEALEGATRVVARPKGRGIRARAGQFAFLSVARRGLREPHPFTLSRVGADRSIEFCIQPAGDFTRRLRETLQPGDRLRVEGGYGRFDFRRGSQRQVWLAGGIGITPFLAMAETLAQQSDGREVVLVHAVRTRDLAIAEDRLRDLSAAHPGFTYHLHASADAGRMDAAALVSAAPFAVKGADLMFCGPGGLRKAIVAGLKAAGHSPRTVHFERFEFR